MELRRTFASGFAWAGLVIVVAVPTVEAVRSRLMPTGAGLSQSSAEVNTPAEISPSVAPAGAQVVKQKMAEIVEAPPAVVAAPPVVASAVQAAPAVVQASSEIAATPPHPVPKAVPSISVPSTSPPLPATTEASTGPASAAAPLTKTGQDTVVDQYLATGRPLSSYVKASPTPRPVSVASAQAPAYSTQRSELDPVASAQAASTEAPGNAPASAGSSVVAAPPPVPMPVASRPKSAPQRLVTEADLKGWKSGSLADYLRQQGLLSQAETDSDGAN